MTDNKKVLVATATYNEARNISEFIERVRLTLGESQDMLIIDDNSPDGTSDIIRQIKASDSHVHLITRRFKNGLGSAHKMMKIYAIVNNYKYLVTMDADLSHRPEEIPSLLAHSGENVFVIGSRYTIGGKSDYVGFRKMVSRIGNKLARIMLGIKLHELTTSFRVFDVDTLKTASIYRLNSNGYSYFVETVSLMEKIGVRLLEVPIYFKDRKNDVSKIPKSQVIKSFVDLVSLALRRNEKPLRPSLTKMRFSYCRSCGEYSLLPIWQDGRDERFDELTSDNFKCSSVQTGSKRPVLQECLSCGLIQIPPATYGSAVSDFYFDTDDETYLENFNVKMLTFKSAFKKISRYLPKKKLKILDIGSYYGAFIEVAKSEGHTVVGVEPSRVAARYSSEVLGHNVITDIFSKGSQFSGMGFDIVTSWDVIEHLENPDDFIREISFILEDGRIFVFSTIMIDSQIAKLLKKRWHWILPMHLTYFSERVIVDILQRHGFELLGSFNHTHYASLPYALKGVMKNMNPFVRSVGMFVSKYLPKSCVFPFALGDVRLFICKKVNNLRSDKNFDTESVK